MTSRQLARLLRQCLEEGANVEIDGLGTFRSAHGEFKFVPQGRPSVFLAYVEEDFKLAERLYMALKREGFDPWLDRRKLLAGQNWPRSIERAIAVTDFFIACFSPRSIAKRGAFQAELRHALDCASKRPLDQVFFIPVRLEECDVPARVRQELQYVDLFPAWSKGIRQIVLSMRKQAKAAARPAA